VKSLSLFIYVPVYVCVCVCSCTRARHVISVPQNRRNLSENRIHKRMLPPEKDLQKEKYEIRKTRMYQAHPTIDQTTYMDA